MNICLLDNATFEEAEVDVLVRLRLVADMTRTPTEAYIGVSRRRYKNPYIRPPTLSFSSIIILTSTTHLVLICYAFENHIRYISRRSTQSSSNHDRLRRRIDTWARSPGHRSMLRYPPHPLWVLLDRLHCRRLLQNPRDYEYDGR
ncbi:hypothetical protein NEOLEDRAFT_1167507 [Neolentinus lepideus HHB14362 ss-1]|uniref:Uncharacterized protein n=1 Tax=Neolentinus lepideus HHB14362 ss-1 TaxID=1314782 RepID=A0A165US36_9AGAM|nr:hypothetical protein NEOLEDRAFT_1167507 [Neolentinus lepideus HHB14362 ss-1]